MLNEMDAAQVSGSLSTPFSNPGLQGVSAAILLGWVPSHPSK